MTACDQVRADLAGMDPGRILPGSFLEALFAVRVNIVVYAGEEEALRVVERLTTSLGGIQDGLEVRFLNDLSSVEASGRAMDRIRDILGGHLTHQTRRAGTSNLTSFFQGHDGLRFSMKRSDLYFLEAICGGCKIKHACHEGFYGVRIERRAGTYCVRLCIYKHDSDVLMPWQDFLASPLVETFRN